ncbi:Kelch-like protein diablo [Sergentomyia squamirostris]
MFKPEFSKFRNENIFSDALLRLSDGSSFLVHRLILGIQSQYFLALFKNSLSGDGEGDVREFLIPGIRKEIMEKILQFIYTQQIQLSKENVLEVLTVSDYLLVNDLVEMCKVFLRDSLDAQNSVKILLFAESRFHQDLFEVAQKFILRNFVQIMDTCSDLYNLDYEQFRRIVWSDFLNVRDEMFVWNACLKWINNSGRGIKEIYQVVQLVRMALMNIEDIRTHIEHHAMIIESPEARGLVEKVFKFLYDLEMSQEILQYKQALPRIPHEVIFTVGGWSEGSARNQIETYDTRADRWVRIRNEDPAGPRAYHGTVVVGERIFCVGGFNGRDYFNNCRILDTVTKEWHTMAPMNVRRCYVSVAYLNGFIYALGGYDGNMRQKSCERYDLRTNQWNMIAPMHVKRSDACATVLNGKIYICGGFNGQECMNTAEFYDPIQDVWSFITPMMERRSGLKCIAYHGKIYAVGGFNGVNRLRSCETYDPDAEHWVSIANMLNPRSNFAIEIIDDLIFAMAGFNGTFTISDVECYTPETDEWLMAMNMNVVRSGLTACILSDTVNIHDYVYPCRAELVEERRQTPIFDLSDSETENS